LIVHLVTGTLSLLIQTAKAADGRNSALSSERYSIQTFIYEILIIEKPVFCYLLLKANLQYLAIVNCSSGIENLFFIKPMGNLRIVIHLQPQLFI